MFFVISRDKQALFLKANIRECVCGSDVFRLVVSCHTASCYDNIETLFVQVKVFHAEFQLTLLCKYCCKATHSECIASRNCGYYDIAILY